MKDAVDLLNERIADLEKRNKALVKALKAVLRTGASGRPWEIAEDALKEHGGE